MADEFNNRIQFFEPDGTFLGTFGEPGSDPGQFDGPTGVDSRGEMVFVADRNNHRIQILNPDGGVVDVIGEGPGDDPGMFDNPFGVTVDRLTGEIYVADTYNHRIQKFDPEGNFMGIWGSKGSGTEQFDNPTSIALGTDGLVYVADSNNNRIQVRQVNGEDGEFIDSIGKKGTADGRFNLPYGVAVDEVGNLFVADLDNNRIQKFDTEGSFIGKYGSEGAGDGEFSAPIEVAAADNGSLYVADDLNNRIQVFTEGVIVLDGAVPDDNDGVQQVFTLAGIGPGSYTFTELPVPGWQLIGISCEGADYQADLASRTLTIDLAEAQTADCIFENALTGTITIHKEASPADGIDFSFNSNALPVFTYLKQWGGSGSGNGKFNSPAGVDVDAGGNVYVADEFNHRIQVFGAGGKYLRQRGKQGAGNSEFSFPTDVEVAAGGISYVVDSGNNRVQKFDANGNYLAK